MIWILSITVFWVAFFLMEFVAWFTHKYVMHGLLWMLHKDHHQKQEENFFERNDFFFLIFATPGIALLAYGIAGGGSIVFSWGGAGITAYGFTYFLVHDIFIHQRFKIFKRSNNSYLRAIRKAHKVHHKHLGKKHGECFGMLLVPYKYFREAQKSKNV